MERQFSTLREKIAFEKQERIARHSVYADTIEKAIKAGLEAGRDCRPVPMYVLENNIPIDRIDDGPVVLHGCPLRGIQGLASGLKSKALLAQIIRRGCAIGYRNSDNQWIENPHSLVHSLRY